MRLNYIWLSLSILILISGCTSRPRLNPYVPKENVKVLQNNKILFTSKSYSIKVTNGKTTTRKQHMTPVPAKGAYTIKVFVKHKELLAEKTIKLIIN